MKKYFLPASNFQSSLSETCSYPALRRRFFASSVIQNQRRYNRFKRLNFKLTLTKAVQNLIGKWWKTRLWIGKRKLRGWNYRRREKQLEKRSRSWWGQTRRSFLHSLILALPFLLLSPKVRYFQSHSVFFLSVYLGISAFFGPPAFAALREFYLPNLTNPNSFGLSGPYPEWPIYQASPFFYFFFCLSNLFLPSSISVFHVACHYYYFFEGIKFISIIIVTHFFTLLILVNFQAVSIIMYLRVWVTNTSRILCVMQVAMESTEGGLYSLACTH